MKLYITTCHAVEINHPIINTLHDIHNSAPNAIGTDEQYAEAIQVVEQATGIKFLDPDVDGVLPAEPRITSVVCEWDDVVVLEA